MKIIKFGLLALALTANANAFVLRLTTGGGNDIVTNASGVQVPIEIVVGYYTSGPTGTNAAADFANFNALYTFSSPDGQFISGAATQIQIDPWNGTNTGSPAIGKDVYAWVFTGDYDGTASSGSAADNSKGNFASASQYGLFFGSNKWVDSTAGSTFFSFSDSFATGSIPTQTVYGSNTDSNGIGTTGGTATYQLVPEPSTAMLGLLAGFGLLTRRRRD